MASSSMLRRASPGGAGGATGSMVTVIGVRIPQVQRRQAADDLGDVERVPHARRALVGRVKVVHQLDAEEGEGADPVAAAVRVAVGLVEQDVEHEAGVVLRLDVLDGQEHAGDPLREVEEERAVHGRNDQRHCYTVGQRDDLVGRADQLSTAAHGYNDRRRRRESGPVVVDVLELGGAVEDVGDRQ